MRLSNAGKEGEHNERYSRAGNKHCDLFVLTKIAEVVLRVKNKSSSHSQTRHAHQKLFF